MKVTQAELLDFLKHIGVDVEIADEGSEFDKDTLLTAVDSNRRKVLQPIIEEEVMDANIAKIKASQGGSLRSALARKTGIKRNTLDEFKTDEEAIEAAINYKLGLLDSEKAEFNNKLQEIVEAHQQELERVKQEKEAEVKQANERYIRKDIISHIRAKLDNIPIPKGANKEIIAEDIYKELSQAHHLSYDEAKKEVALFIKENPTMPLMNESKNSFITIEDKAKEYLTPRGLIVEDLSGVDPTKVMPEVGDRRDTTTPPAPSLTSNIGQKRQQFMESLQKTVEQSQPA